MRSIFSFRVGDYLWSVPLRDPNKMVLGPKYYNINGIWALKPYYLGPRTLRVLYEEVDENAPASLRHVVLNLKGALS